MRKRRPHTPGRSLVVRRHRRGEAGLSATRKWTGKLVAASGRALRRHAKPLAEKAFEKGAGALGKARDGTRRFATEFSKGYSVEAAQRKQLDETCDDGHWIPPWHILAGLGSLDRRALCDSLAIFRSASLARISADRGRDLVRRAHRSPAASGEPAFAARVRKESDDYYGRLAEWPDRRLRWQLWALLRDSLGLSPALPLSCDSASHRCAELADRAGRYYSDRSPAPAKPAEAGQRMGRWFAEQADKASKWVARQPPDFSRTVRRAAARTVTAALQGDDLSADQRRRLEAEFRSRLEHLPAELRDQSLEEAVRSGDWAAVAAAGSAGSLAGLAIGVELAGFGAYIAAAKASAIIPFLGGKTAVSLLAVVSSPLFVIPALAGGAYAMNRGMNRKTRRGYAAGLAVQLALQGLAAQSDGLQRCLDEFKELADSEIADAGLVSQRSHVRGTVGRFPATPSAPDSTLPTLGEMPGADALGAVLFPESRGRFPEASAIAGLGVADVLFDAAAIDPRVIQAADFARAEDLDGIFKFGAFAERVEAMDGLAQIGAESQLRGYVAELVVASHLASHDVSLPDAPNTAGYDLLVDGNPFQVKCYADSSTGMRALTEHFEKHPDIPVYVNGELMPAVESSAPPWADQVFAVEGFDYSVTERILQESLHAGSSLRDLDIPVFAIAVSASRHVFSWWKGSIPLKDVPFEVAVDGAVHGSMAVAGGFTGTAVGLLLFGPAGGVIFSGAGQLAGVLGAGKVRDKFDDLRAKEWMESVGEAAERFRAALYSAMQSKRDRLLNKAGRLTASDSGLQAWMRLKFHDRALGVAECMAELRYRREGPLAKAKAALRLMREAGVHPQSVKPELSNLIETLAARPSVRDQVSDIATHTKRKLWHSGDDQNLADSE